MRLFDTTYFELRKNMNTKELSRKKSLLDDIIEIADKNSIRKTVVNSKSSDTKTHNLNIPTLDVTPIDDFAISSDTENKQNKQMNLQRNYSSSDAYSFRQKMIESLETNKVFTPKHTSACGTKIPPIESKSFSYPYGNKNKAFWGKSSNESLATNSEYEFLIYREQFDTCSQLPSRNPSDTSLIWSPNSRPTSRRNSQNRYVPISIISRPIYESVSMTPSHCCTNKTSNFVFPKKEEWEATQSATHKPKISLIKSKQKTCCLQTLNSKLNSLHLIEDHRSISGSSVSNSSYYSPGHEIMLMSQKALEIMQETGVPTVNKKKMSSKKPSKVPLLGDSPENVHSSSYFTKLDSSVSMSTHSSAKTKSWKNSRGPSHSSNSGNKILNPFEQSYRPG